MKSSSIIWGLLPAISLLACGGPLPDDTDAPATLETASLSGLLPYRGVSLASAELAVDPSGNGPLPGKHGADYVYPDPHYVPGYDSADYFVSKGMTTFRLPFRWERLQPTRNAALDAAELTRLTTTTDGLLAKGAAVILDPHNYARYGTSVIGSGAVPAADFADFWGRLASIYKNNPRVVFAVMNEPHDVSTEQWVGAANAAIAAIRATGATNLILVPGNGWDGAQAWSESWYGTANATAMLQITDPGNNYAYEVHQYLDDDSSGKSQTCTGTKVGSERLAAFTGWLKANGKRGFLGEFAGGPSATCVAALDDLLGHLEANSDVWLGWTFSAAGPWSGGGSIEPTGGPDEVRMKMMLPHLAWSSSSNATSSGVTAGAGATCAATTHEAESMTHSTGGSTTGGWNLWSNGYVSTSQTFVAGSTHLTVSAAGQSAAGVWPHMIVSVDGVTIGQTMVSTTSWSSFSFPYAATAGSHQIKVAFDNDYYLNGQDRNLLVDKVVVTCDGTGTGSGTGSGSGSTTGAGGASTGSGSTTGAGGASTGSGSTTGSGGSGGAGGAGGGTTSGKWVSGYYVGYQQNLYPPSAIDWGGLTHLFVGRVVPNSNGTLNTTFDIGAAGPAFAKNLVQLAHQNGKKAVVMLGGAGAESGWVGAASAQNRAAFVQNLKQLAVDYGFDGFDLDWEPLPTGDQAAFKALAQAIRAAMPSTLLTVPVQWVTMNASVSSFFGSIAPLFDQINLMSYSMSGAWGGWQSWHSSALYGEASATPSSVDLNVKAYLAAGVPASKLGIGIAFYGSCWSSPVAQPKQSLGGSQIVADDNTMTFDNIMNSYYSATSHHWDATASVPYLGFSSSHGPQGCTFVSYEDPQSIVAKGAYVKQKGLGGTIVWTINQGYRPGQAAGQRDPLMEALKQGFLQ